MIKILIVDGLAKEGLTQIQNIPGTEVIAESAMERDKLKSLLSGAQVLIVRSRTQVDEDLLSASKSLRLVIRAGIGLDNIDLKAASKAGVTVVNAPKGNIVTTAEHAIALLFALSRRVAQADASMKAGKWDKKSFQGNEITGKTLGVLGFGNIGKAVAQRGAGLCMNVLAHDPYLKPGTEFSSVTFVSLEDLLQKSDYLTLHLPFNESTKGLIGEAALRKMKKGAFLINCARGGIVNENALCTVISEKHLAGAALDVFEKEPLPLDSPLLQRPEILLTPHLGASTHEAQVQVGLEVAELISGYVLNGTLKNVIVSPPARTSAATQPEMAEAIL